MVQQMAIYFLAMGLLLNQTRTINAEKNSSSVLMQLHLVIYLISKIIASYSKTYVTLNRTLYQCTNYTLVVGYK